MIIFYSWISFDFLKFLFDGVVLQVWAWKPGDGRELASRARIAIRCVASAGLMSRGDSRDLGLQLLQALVERHRVRAWDAEYDLDAVAAQRSRKPRAAAFQHHACAQ